MRPNGHRRHVVFGIPGLARRYLDVRRARALGRAPATLPLLSVELTQDCNARCGMCGFPTSYPRTGTELGTGAICDLVDQARALGALVISLGGGEPFLRADTDAIIEHIDQRGVTPFVHTNGTLLGRERCRALGRLSGAIVALSLDSHRRAVHDRIRGIECFDSVLAAARYLATHAPRVRVVFTFTITALNVGDMLPTARLARDLGVRAIRFTPLHDNLQHRYLPRENLAAYRLRPEHLPQLTREVDRVLRFIRASRMVCNSPAFLRGIPASASARVEHDCFAGFFFSSVDPYGNLFPCYDHAGGVNLRDFDSLEAAFRSPAMDRLRARVLSCRENCWNVGTAEPSLRLNRRFAAKQAPQLVRESLFFRA